MEKDLVACFCTIDSHQRLDHLVADCFPQFSRGLLQQWIKQGDIVVNDTLVKSASPIHAQDKISIQATLPVSIPDQPIDLKLDIIHEDSHLLVINKPSGLTTHPGAGKPTATLLNALLAYNPNQRYLPRAGLVHRLDKGTSGLIVVAKQMASLLRLQQQLKKHRIERHYLALVEGVPISGGTIDYSIARDPHHRLIFKAYPNTEAVSQARTAITHYRIKRKFAKHCLLEVCLETGRTHQIRCHLAAIGFPLVGDKLYGAKGIYPTNGSPSLKQILQEFNHQALHAHRLTVYHPHSNVKMKWIAPLPADMQHLLKLLEETI